MQDIILSLRPSASSYPEVKQRSRRHQVDERLALGIVEAARLLGISPGRLYQAVRERRLPAVRLGRRILIPTSGLRAFLDERK